jgi:hypothetical protein
MSRTFGIEIEFFTTNPWNQHCLNENQIFDNLRKHSKNIDWSKWTLKRDGSVNGDGREITSPPLSGPKGMEEIKEALLALQHIGFVNSSCGLHVHVGVPDFSYSRILFATELWTKLQKQTNPFLKPSRINGKFSKHMSNETIEILREYETMRKATAEQSFGRYFHLNPFAFLVHSTVEFRGLEGTLDPKVILSWIEIVVDFIEQVGAAPIIENLSEKEKYEIIESLINDLIPDYIKNFEKLLVLIEKVNNNNELTLKKTNFLRKFVLEKHKITNAELAIIFDRNTELSIRNVLQYYNNTYFTNNISFSTLKSGMGSFNNICAFQVLFLALFNEANLKRTVFNFAKTIMETQKVKKLESVSRNRETFDEKEVILFKNISKEAKQVFEWRKKGFEENK